RRPDRVQQADPRQPERAGLLAAEPAPPAARAPPPRPQESRRRRGGVRRRRRGIAPPGAASPSPTQPPRVSKRDKPCQRHLSRFSTEPFPAASVSEPSKDHTQAALRGRFTRSFLRTMHATS